jgi:hypothetical protein
MLLRRRTSQIDIIFIFLEGNFATLCVLFLFIKGQHGLVMESVLLSCFAVLLFFYQHLPEWSTLCYIRLSFLFPLMWEWPLWEHNYYG